MTRPIQVGDLVIIVRGHSCTMERYRGAIFRVAKIVPATGGGWRCVHCKLNDQWGPEPGAYWKEKGGSAPLSWLKRIPPLDELEGEKTQESLKETA